MKNQTKYLNALSSVLLLPNKIHPIYPSAVSLIAGYQTMIAKGKEQATIPFLILGASIIKAIYFSNKILSNEFGFYALSEDNTRLDYFPIGKTPSYKIDGIAIQGKQTVFKVPDSFNIWIDRFGNIKHTFVPFTNKIVGKKDLTWCLNQSNKAWITLYNKANGTNFK